MISKCSRGHYRTDLSNDYRETVIIHDGAGKVVGQTRVFNRRTQRAHAENRRVDELNRQRKG